jgi:hypothetical protein
MANPKGTIQNLIPHQITTDREEPLTSKLQLRVTKSMLDKLNNLDDKAEFCRKAIEEALLKYDV